MRRVKRYASPDVIVLLTYSLLTILFTFPLAFRIGSALPGIAPDTYQYIWNLEWVRRALLDLGTNPFFTREIYYPTGVSLYFHTLILGSDLLTLPLQLALGNATAYMLATLAMFVLSGYGGYLLAYDLVRRRGVAFFAGLALTFSPYHMSHLLYSHFNLMPLQWLALFILAAKKMFDRPGYKFMLLTLVLMLWTSLTDWYYALYELLFLAIYTLYRLWRGRSWRVLILVGSIGLLYVIALSPLLLPMIGEAGVSAASFRGPEEADRFSADLLSYFVPSAFHPVWGSAVAELAAKFHGGAAERTLFLGYTVLALLLVALFSARKHKRELFFWFLAGLAFMLLSLGPHLHIAGASRPGDRIIDLPYELILQVPGLSAFFAIARSISRYGIMAMLCFTLLAAFGLKELLDRLPPRGRAVGLAFACAAVAFEFLAVPVPTTAVPPPPSLDVLEAAQGDFATLDLPLSFPSGGEAMYYWTFTHKPTMNGYHSRLLPFPIFVGVPSLRTVLRPTGARDILTGPQPSAAQVLNFFDVRYIVLHKRPDAADAVEGAAEWISSNFPGLAPLADDQTLRIYAVPAARPVPNVISLEWSGGEPEDFGGGHIWRWMDNDAKATIYSARGGPAVLHFQARSLVDPRHLQVILNGSEVFDGPVPSDDIVKFQIPNLPLRAGENQLLWHSVEPPAQPSALGLNDDPRFLSIAFSQLRLDISR